MAIYIYLCMHTCMHKYDPMNRQTTTQSKYWFRKRTRKREMEHNMRARVSLGTLSLGRCAMLCLFVMCYASRI